MFSASIDLRWFTPKEAQKVLDISLRLNLLSKNDGELVPTFSLEDVDVPMEFKPTSGVLDTHEEVLFQKIVTKLSESRLERSELVARINDLQKKYGLEVEVAALMVGNDLHVDLKEFIPAVEEELRKRAAELGKRSERRNDAEAVKS